MKLFSPLIKQRASQTFKSALEQHGGVGPGFDLLRIGLALAIFYGHAKWIAGSSTGPGMLAHDLIQQGAAVEDAAAAAFDPSIMGSIKRVYHLALVPMFFALSGFLVSGSAFRTRALRSFLAFRALRIFPALSVEVTLSALLVGPIFTTVPIWSYLADPQFFRYFGNIFGFVTMLLPGVFETNPVARTVNANLWTLPGEFYSYLITSALIFTGAFFNRTLFTLLSVLLTLAVLLGCAFWSFGVTRGSLYGAPVIVYYFVVGCLFYQWRDLVPFRWSYFVVASLLGAIALAFPKGVFIAPFFVTYSTIFLGAVKWPRVPLLQSGDYSYGIYLYGFPISQALIASAPLFRGHENWFALTALLLTFGFAVVSWELIERPALKLKRLFGTKTVPIDPSNRTEETLKDTPLTVLGGP